MSELVRTRIEDRERGAALILVIGVGALLAVLSTVAVTVALGGMRQARADGDRSAAIAAAHAGVEEYQSRLMGDPEHDYALVDNPDSTFSYPCDAEPGLVPPTSDEVAANPALDVGSSGTWAEVLGSDDPEISGSDDAAHFRYEVDNSRLAVGGATDATTETTEPTDGTAEGTTDSTTGGTTDPAADEPADASLWLRSTGRAGGWTRTIVARLTADDSSTFRVTGWVEVSPAMGPDGSYRDECPA